MAELVARVLVAKHADHLPQYRQKAIFSPRNAGHSQGETGCLC